MPCVFVCDENGYQSQDNKPTQYMSTHLDSYMFAETLSEIFQYKRQWERGVVTDRDITKMTDVLLAFRTFGRQWIYKFLPNVTFNFDFG